MLLPKNICDAKKIYIFGIMIIVEIVAFSVKYQEETNNYRCSYFFKYSKNYDLTIFFLLLLYYPFIVQVFK